MRGRVRQDDQGVDLGSWTLAKDTVAGVTIHWLGKIGGKSIVEMRVRWRKGDALEPDWDVGMGWTIEIQGRPTITTKVDILPPPYFEATTMEEFMVLGHILTALPSSTPSPPSSPPRQGSSRTKTSRFRCPRATFRPNGWAKA